MGWPGFSALERSHTATLLDVCRKTKFDDEDTENQKGGVESIIVFESIAWLFSEDSYLHAGSSVYLLTWSLFSWAITIYRDSKIQHHHPIPPFAISRQLSASSNAPANTINLLTIAWDSSASVVLVNSGISLSCCLACGVMTAFLQ
jgi:hypothetical protein